MVNPTHQMIHLPGSCKCKLMWIKVLAEVINALKIRSSCIIWVGLKFIHGVIKVHEKNNGDIKFLTEGDNNEVDDRSLYKEGQNWLKKDMVERSKMFSSYVGIVTIIMNDYPKFKYALLAAMGAHVLLKHES
uniref:Uncharacterized protein n=1 Tax=Sus scrofa TaxID=9823 RepID=A0A4X1TZL3_PIG